MKNNNELYIIDSNNQKKLNSIFSTILLVLYIIVLILIFISLFICKNKNYSNVLFIVACIFLIINSLLIIFWGLLNKDEDYDKYKNYTLILKDNLKKYESEIQKYQDEIKELNEEILKLKSRIN